MNPEQDFTCPDCGHNDYEATNASFEDRGVYKCSRCGFPFLNPSNYSGHEKKKPA